jgi:hypothetical protein
MSEWYELFRRRIGPVIYHGIWLGLVGTLTWYGFQQPDHGRYWFWGLAVLVVTGWAWKMVR